MSKECNNCSNTASYQVSLVDRTGEAPVYEIYYCEQCKKKLFEGLEAKFALYEEV